MWRRIVISTLLAILSSGVVLASVTVQASVSQTRIYDNQDLEYTISISGDVNNYPEIDLDNMKDWDVLSSGTTRNYTWINGQSNQSVDITYRLTPRSSGTLTIPSQTIEIDGKRHVTKSLQVQVLKSSQPQPQARATPPQGQRGSASADNVGKDDLFLEASVDKDTVYVNEQITLTIKFFRDVQPLQTPDYSEPTWTGFWKEDLPPQRTYAQRVNGQNYHVNEIKKALFPTAAGTHTIGSATIAVVVSERSRQDPFSVFNNFNSLFGRSKTVTLHSDPISVVAIPLPEKSQPKNFSGAVGHFTISSKVDKTKVEVNEPITLTLKINGTGNVKSIVPPDLPDLPDFRSYEASDNEKTERVNFELGGSRSIEHVLIPKRAGNYTLPGVQFSFFDPKSKSYQTVSTKPVAVEVTPASERFTSSLQNLQTNQLDLTAKDIRYLKSDIGELHGKRSDPLPTKPLAFLLYLVPVVGYLVVVQQQRRREKLASDLGLRRLKRARKMAEKRLSEAKQHLQGGEAEKFYAETHKSLIEYFADRFNLPAHGLTEEKIREFADGRPDGNLIDRMVNLLKQCDFGRFAPGGSEAEIMGKLWEDSRELIVEMEKQR